MTSEPIPERRSCFGTNMTSTYIEPQRQRPHKPPTSLPVAGSDSNTDKISDLESPALSSLNRTSAIQSISNAFGGGSSVTTISTTGMHLVPMIGIRCPRRRNAQPPSSAHQPRENPPLYLQD